MICVDDEPEVLEAVERDLSTLEDTFPLEVASSAAEVRDLLVKIEHQGDELGLIFCDHVMPGETGVELLEWMEGSDTWRKTKKALLTGQAGFDATVQAVNHAGLDYYVAKPWSKEGLLKTARDLLTNYVLESGRDPLAFMKELDAVALSKALHKRGLISDD